MKKLKPQDLKHFVEDLARIGREHDRLLSHPKNRALTHGLGKLRKQAEEKYAKVSENK